MDVFNRFGYVTGREKTFTDRSTYNDTLYVYKKDDPSIIFSRRQMTYMGKQYTRYGLVMPFDQREIRISYDLGNELHQDPHTLMNFMNMLNHLYARGEIFAFDDRVKSLEQKVKALGS